MAVLDSAASTFSLEEENGGALLLRGRALPYMPITVGGKQRAEFTWYPGSPQATVQMLGPEEDSITLRGFWKDKFVQGSGDALYLSGGANQPLAGEIAIGSVQDLVKIVDDMRRMGRRIKLTWGSLIRFGHITSFVQTWHTVHYCEWEIEFSVASQEESAVSAGVPPLTNYADISAQAVQIAADVRAEQIKVITATQLNPIQATSKLINDLDNLVTEYSNKIVGITQVVATSITLPADAARRLMAVASGAVVSVSQAVGTGVDTALQNWYAFDEFQGQDAIPFGIQLQGASYLNSWNTSVNAVKYNNAIWRYEASKQLQNELRASFVAPQAMDLRDVSTRFYRTPNNWRALMVYNGLTTSALTAGQLIWVPEDPQTAGAGLTQGGVS